MRIHWKAADPRNEHGVPLGRFFCFSLITRGPVGSPLPRGEENSGPFCGGCLRKDWACCQHMPRRNSVWTTEESSSWVTLPAHPEEPPLLSNLPQPSARHLPSSPGKLSKHKEGRLYAQLLGIKMKPGWYAVTKKKYHQVAERPFSLASE